MKKIKTSNKFFIGAGLIIFSLIAFAVYSAVAPTTAVVLKNDTPAGTTITQDMVEEIKIPKATPEGYFKTPKAIVGERLTQNVKKQQLLYPSNVMSSIQLGQTQRKGDYVLASVLIPDTNAMGGVLTSGDVVDIAVVPKDGEVDSLAKALPGFDIDTSLNGGFYYVLSNVRLVDTTTSVSEAKGTELSNVKNKKDSSGGNEGGSSYYVVSLSYNDYKKLRLAEEFGNLYLNLSPEQNKDHAPLIEDMAAPVEGGLSDANVSKYDKKSKTKAPADKSAEKTPDSNKE